MDITRSVSRTFDVASLWNADLSDSVTTASLQDKRVKLEKLLSRLSNSIQDILDIVIGNSDFSAKYDVAGTKQYIYQHTRQPNPHTFVTELFPLAQLPPNASKHWEELSYHRVFEEAIQRYTDDRRKPNPVLLETRPSNFCYQLTVKFEAIPESKARSPEPWQLLREFQILQFFWECHRSELRARKCHPDQLVGFPMPFEFNNIVGSPLYDFPKKTIEQLQYYNIHGKLTKLFQVPVTAFGFGTSTNNILSSLSYMSIEKVGPNLTYLMDLMQSQGQAFSLSTALKIYDQLISRLMILHQFGVTHCDVNPGCLNFGCKEAANVLYINRFDKAIVCGADHSPLPFYNDRFASYLQTKERKCHFLYDLESAFYVFVYMLLGRLPWDSRLQQESQDESDDTAAPVANRSNTVDVKEKFWNSQEGFHWVAKSVAFEFYEPLYCNFSTDLLDTLYGRMKDSVAACLSMTTAAFFKQMCIPGSAPHNCYFGMRRVIASYFRFESLNLSMKDVTCNSKLEMLAKEDPQDKRAAWDLSNWCWNYLDPDLQDRGAHRRTSQIRFE